MSHELIKLGVLPNDGSGDPLRVAFDKINNNFTALFSVSDIVPEKIVTGNKPNDGGGDTLRTAFAKLNKNLLNLHNINPSVPTIQVNITDPLRTTFESINSLFNVAFDIIAPNYVVPVETITPDINNASYVGNINITNYNFYVDNKQPAAPKPQITSASTFADPLTITAVPYGSQEWVNVGTLPNDGTGDPLRTAFQKINNNFSNLFYTATTTTTAHTSGATQNQTIYDIPVSQFTQGTFQIKTKNSAANDSQDIILSAQITNDLLDVKFTGYATTFQGSYLCSYDMDVLGDTVRILVNPLSNYNLVHFIAATVTYAGSGTPGLDIQLDGYVVGDYMSTQDGNILTTEGI